MPNVFGSDGPAVRSKDNQLVSGSSWARPVTSGSQARTMCG